MQLKLSTVKWMCHRNSCFFWRKVVPLAKATICRKVPSSQLVYIVSVTKHALSLWNSWISSHVRVQLFVLIVQAAFDFPHSKELYSFSLKLFPRISHNLLCPRRAEAERFQRLLCFCIGRRNRASGSTVRVAGLWRCPLSRLPNCRLTLNWATPWMERKSLAHKLCQWIHSINGRLNHFPYDRMPPFRLKSK